ncbi:hypothetical protein KY285_033113 [Solanum tuberosum]|nr:hypothetical protein KY285_033113 [Solanum tuberosum]
MLVLRPSTIQMALVSKLMTMSDPRPIVPRVPQPNFAFDVPQKTVLEVFEKAHEHAEEQCQCPVPIQSMDPINVTTHLQFELDDHFMPSLNSIKSIIAPQSTIIRSHRTAVNHNCRSHHNYCRSHHYRCPDRYERRKNHA